MHQKHSLLKLWNHLKKFLYKDKSSQKSFTSNYEEFTSEFDPELVFKTITASLGTETIPILSYGTLISDIKALEIVKKDVIARKTLVIAEDLIRIFDKDTDKSSSNARAGVNIRKARSQSAQINGVVHHLDKEDFIALCKRNQKSDLIPIKIKIWQDKANSFPTNLIAYAFALSDSDYLSNDIIPKPSDYFNCREAAKNLGEDFLEMWLETTYLADGTKVKK